MAPSGLIFSVLQVTNTTSGPSPIGGIGGHNLLFTIIELAFVLAFIVAAGALLNAVIRSIAIRAGASKQVVGSVRSWIGVIVIVLGVAAAASITGLSSEVTTLTISGIGGLGVTLALQTTLSNIIAGVLMLHDGVLRLGDDISFQEVRGEVVKLSLRTTWIKTSEGLIAVIGNSNLAAGPVVNYTARARLEKKLQL